jgi:hypothetical protein
LLNEETRQIATTPDSSIPAIGGAMAAVVTGKGKVSKGTGQLRCDLLFLRKDGALSIRIPGETCLEEVEGRKERKGNGGMGLIRF